MDLNCFFMNKSSLCISFICVNYNNSKFSIDYVNSLLAMNVNESVNVRIFIIDNNSSLLDFQNLDTFILNLKNDHVQLIRLPENIGYFKALNVGLKQILNFSKNYVVIGNNDLQFDRNFLQVLQKFTFEDNVLAISPNIIRKDGIHQNPHLTKKFSKLQKLYLRIFYSSYFCSIILSFFMRLIKQNISPENRRGNDIEQNIHLGYGACYILTQNFFKHFNYLDSPVFLMGEELIFSNQIFSVDGVLR
jgi:GT2 family glycosyltransferase